MEFKSKMVRNVMWNSDVAAENWCEADGRLFRETLASLNLISITVAAAVQLQGAGWRQLVFGSCLPRPTRERCLAGIGKLCKGPRMTSRSAMLGAQAA